MAGLFAYIVFILTGATGMPRNYPVGPAFRKLDNFPVKTPAFIFIFLQGCSASIKPHFNGFPGLL